MHTYDLIIIGFGVIGSESLYAINKLHNNKNSKIRIAIIDKDLKNIPGGIAYSLEKSKYGFFNNPLRLSHPEFKKWINKPKNFKKCCKFLSDNPSYNLNDWLGKNKKISNNILEMYFPRFFYSFYLSEKILKVIENKNKSLKIDFFKGCVNNLNVKDNKISVTGTNFSKYSIDQKNDKINLINKNFKIKIIKTKKIILGLGLLPPKKIKSNFKKSFYYIWDFYADGATQNLINKINKLKDIKKEIIIIFIGNKAGFLETVQKMEKLIINNKLNIKIYCIASRNKTLQKAILSNKYQKYKFKYLKISEINKIKNPSKILSLIKKEFIFSKKKGFNKYDIWTLILRKKILNKCYKKLTDKGKKDYNSKIFKKIRDITRYTYPETVNAKERLEKLGRIKLINDKVKFIKKVKNKFQIITKKNKVINGDIINNVSGPVNVVENYRESPLIRSLKVITKKYDKSGFFTDKDFKLESNIFSPGVISNNFNPERETIIKAITNNVYKVTKKLVKEIQYERTN